MITIRNISFMYVYGNALVFYGDFRLHKKQYGDDDTTSQNQPRTKHSQLMHERSMTNTIRIFTESYMRLYKNMLP